MTTDLKLIAKVAKLLNVTETEVVTCYRDVSRVYSKKLTYLDILKVVYKLPEVTKRHPTVTDVIGTFQSYEKRATQQDGLIQATVENIESPIPVSIDQGAVNTYSQMIRQQNLAAERKAKKQKKDEWVRKNTEFEMKRLPEVRQRETLARQLDLAKRQEIEMRKSILRIFVQNPLKGLVNIFTEDLSPEQKSFIEKSSRKDISCRSENEKIIFALHEYRTSSSSYGQSSRSSPKLGFCGSDKPRDFANPTHRRW